MTKAIRSNSLRTRRRPAPARQRIRPDLVLLDIWMPDTDGVTLLKEWSSTGLLSMPVIMMSGHATIDTAVEATKIGAHSFLEKPITLQKLLKAVEQGLARRPRASRPPERARRCRCRPATHGRGRHDRRQTLPAPWSRWARRRARASLDKPLRDARDEFEKAYFEFHLAKEGGSMTRVAERPAWSAPTCTAS
jgi:DNA-binding NtrC family response regulator